MDTPNLSEFPEYREARAVDEVVLDREGQPTALDEPPFLAGRGHLGILEGSPRQGFDLVGYARTPWALVRTVVKELFAASMGAPVANDANESYRVDVQDDAGNVVTLAGRANSGSDFVFLEYATSGTHTAVLRYGTDGTAPDDTQNSLLAPAGGDIVDCSRSWDSANLILTASGSRIHSEAGVTAREIGFFTPWSDVNNNFATYMVDRAVLSNPVDIATDQTVTMSYEFRM